MLISEKKIQEYKEARDVLQNYAFKDGQRVKYKDMIQSLVNDGHLKVTTRYTNNTCDYGGPLIEKYFGDDKREEYDLHCAYVRETYPKEGLSGSFTRSHGYMRERSADRPIIETTARVAASVTGTVTAAVGLGCSLVAAPFTFLLSIPAGGSISLLATAGISQGTYNHSYNALSKIVDKIQDKGKKDPNISEFTGNAPDQTQPSAQITAKRKKEQASPSALTTALG
ncbi:MAG: hypothetical protein CMP22_06065 [Rickettsiales bacterium]|nr:hypothetical protein [Rickettsiales bacterium]|tara:strand:+ start:336 stop:1013 length:678 start_codon:yes stop_codon:yes gene_type:complete